MNKQIIEIEGQTSGVESDILTRNIEVDDLKPVSSGESVETDTFIAQIADMESDNILLLTPSAAWKLIFALINIVTDYKTETDEIEIMWQMYRLERLLPKDARYRCKKWRSARLYDDEEKAQTAALESTTTQNTSESI